MTIRHDTLSEIVAHARQTLPAECCGLLIGSGDVIQKAVRVRNLAADPNRYQIDPKDHIDARREARQQGLDVLGFYHSHPHSAPEPSATDLAEAAYPDHVYLIVGLRADAADAGATDQQPQAQDRQMVDNADARLFRLLPNGFVNLPLVIVSGER